MLHPQLPPSQTSGEDHLLKPDPFFFAHSNPIENAAAAAAAAGLIDPHRDLHQALVASIANNGVSAIGGGLTTAAVLKSATQQQQNAVSAGAGQEQQTASQEQAQQAAMALLKENVNASTGMGSNGNGQQQQQQQGGSNKSGSSGRSTPSLSGGSGSDPAPGKLFVGGLSWQTSSDKLKEYFNMFGSVTDVLIMKDPITQRSRGFGFITFQDPSTVEKVLKVPIHTLDGKKIDPKHATPKNRPRQANKTKKIFVGGVSQDTSADEVKAYFNQFGAVEETVMLMDQQTKRHRGFGFVTFENEDVVDRVCEIHFHTIKNKKVECKKAQPKDSVTPAAQLLQKRIMLGTLGVQLPTAPGQLIGARGAGVAGINPLAMLQNPTQLLQSPAAAAAAAQQAALISQNPFQVQNAAAAASMANQSGFGKLLTTYPQTALHSVRYAPYSIPATAATANAALMQAHQAQSVAAAAHHQQQQQQQQQHHHHHQQTHSAQLAAAQQQQQQNHQNSASQAHSAAAAAALAANAANGAGAAGAHSLAAAAQQAALVAGNPLNAAAAAAAAAANPAAAYSNYTLANVDMSSFQGVDWSTMYGMGMYV
ncbi:RNA-binding protein Musashi homolog Rbp6 isoform X1 [Drosophila serrata]|uniref:RNA-binding protein Musashi homolog Rbp6 isoform X1 n=1 Tax=Drosophila serrata TaxID=7274 RepID=UPI000A1D2DE0|nr:RNA-binding protein Musashi homolog Rbp6 isoform X1 [Drosophila serrata]XP_020818619.1 RNA-binding protein Musashi homolog Rbp6 isoform X1 [Drosophila serrata]